MTAKEVIKVSQHLPIDLFRPAMEVAEEYQEIPTDSESSLMFFQMVAAVWTSGYVAGVRAERKRHRSKDK